MSQGLSSVEKGPAFLSFVAMTTILLIHISFLSGHFRRSS